MNKLILLIFISFSLLNAYSQEYRGDEANRIVKGADKVWIKDGQSLPSYIHFSANQGFHISVLESRLRDIFELDNNIGLDLQNIEYEILGQQHHRYYLTYKGMRIHNAMFIVHTENDLVFAINGNFFRKISPKNSQTLSEADALSKALNFYSGKKYMWEIPSEEELIKRQSGDPTASYFPKGKLTVIPDYINAPGQHFIAWAFNLYSVEPLRRGEVYVDAQSGAIIFENKLIRNADSVGTAVTKYSGTRPITTNYNNNIYRLRETTRGQGIETYNLQTGTTYGSAVDFTDTDNYWNNVNAQKDEIATDAHWGAQMTYDYYWQRHNRNSINGSGFKLISYVHYSTNYANAFWDGQRMTYGDGNTSMGPLVALDICAHEVSHGLTSFTADLVYQDESGAMNEAFSDIFGTSIEFFAKPGAANWTIGENIGTTMRSMSNPKAYGDPNCYMGTNYYVGTADNGGVHTNSGVLNFWYYLLSQGGSGTNDKGNTYSVTGISIDSAAKVAFRALTVYLTSSSNFADMRFYGIQAAIDLFGPCSPQVAATTNAFYAIGLGSAYVQGVHADFSSPLKEFCTTPAQVLFTNLSSNVVNSTWYFGDGSSSTQLNPTHTYNTTGTFAVKLVADGLSCGKDSIIKTAYISIEAGNRCPHNMPQNGTQTLTSCIGRLFDSGGFGNYPDNKTVSTVIAPPGASQVKLTFLSFKFETGYDYLRIYDGPTTSSPYIGSFDGTNLPGLNGVITSTTGSILLVQESDQGLNMEGFELLWDCTLPSAPPVAAFDVSDTSNCTGTFSFTDRSTNGPNSWFWDFGDGSTSSLQHPTHTYSNAGYYSVSLIVTNNIGQGNITLASVVHANLPEKPALIHAANCGPAVFTLQAPVQTGLTHWYDSQSATTAFATGNTYSTGMLTQSATYWVQNRIAKSPQFTGKVNNTGGGAYFTAAAVHYLVFDISKPLTLKSVKVYAQNAGNRTIMLRNSSGVNIETRTINIPAGECRVTLDFVIAPGTDYQLACAQSNNLYRNNAGCSYPYEINGLVKIKYSSASTAPTDYYYFFYDWEVQEEDCKSPLMPLNVFISNNNPTAAFSYTMNDPVVQFSDQTVNPGICTWDFGDGSSITATNPTHTYTANGTYTVKLKVFNGCGLDSVTQQITIVATGMENPALSSGIKVFPNPTSDKITISGSIAGNTFTICILDITGRLVFKETSSNLSGQITKEFDLSELLSGVYLIQINTDKKTQNFKVIKK